MRIRITYATQAELAADVQQMVHGAVLVRDPAAMTLERDASIDLELEMPDGSMITSRGVVLQILAGHGVAVTLEPHVLDEARRAQGAPPRVREATSSPPPREEPEELTHAQKIQLALRGNRDQRNAILRDKNRMLHVYVLKNSQLTVDDVLAIAKNTQMGPDLYKHIAERPEWFQRAQIAGALARNPKVPGDIAIRALAHVAPDVLRQIAKGIGAPPHVVQAARKRVIAP